MQINHFLPFLICSVNLIFNRLFCNSSLPQQVSSASHSSVILFFFFCSVSHSSLSLFYISFHSVYLLKFHAQPLLLSYCFMLFPFRTTNQIQSRSYSFIQATLTIPLPLPIGNTRTSILATETLTDLSSSVCFS
jgi:hypothetical protein